MPDLFGQPTNGQMLRDAVISGCGLYRYQLRRIWGAPEPDPDSGNCSTCTFVMLNPSTADGQHDDQTIRKCIGFAQREGCGQLEVLNLFAWRATSPTDMFKAKEPIGPENDQYLGTLAGLGSRLIIAAWGVHGVHRNRDREVMAMLSQQPLWCLGTTKFGQPKHPLYLAADTPLEPFNAKARETSRA